MSNIDIYKGDYEDRGGEIQAWPRNNKVKVQVATGNAAALAKPFRRQRNGSVFFPLPFLSDSSLVTSL